MLFFGFYIKITKKLSESLAIIPLENIPRRVYNIITGREQEFPENERKWKK